METKDFAEFVASQQKTEAETKINWAETREEWLRNLDSLHQRIVSFLREYIDQGSISYDFTEIELNEPNIGRYMAKRMDITIGRQRVSLVPVGTLLIGSKGRVDGEGFAGRAQTLQVDGKGRAQRTSSKVR
jgi:hypothetical protein